MKLALFPPPGGGLKTLQRSGQLSRLTDYYLPAYARAFDEVFYFSYLNETLSDYDLTALDPRVHLVPNRSSQPHQIYAFSLAVQQARWLARCAVSRVFQGPGIVPAWRAKRRWGIPIVTTFGYRYAEFARVERRWLAWAYTLVLEQLALQVSNAIIVTTDESADYAARYAPHTRLHLIPNGVDTERFRPAPRSSQSQKPSILFVGRFTPQKNLLSLLKAVAILQETLSVRLDLVGEGPLRDKLEQDAQELGLEAHFLGTIPYEQLPQFYQQANVFVLPSHIEGHPKALLEAMACGLPVVVSDVLGNRAVVTHEINGLMFAANDLEALAQQIRRVLTNPELAHCLGARARATVLAKFDLRRLLETECTLMKQLAKISLPSNDS